MKLPVLAARLAATRALTAEQVGAFTTLAAAASPDVEALRTAIAALFEEIDAKSEKTPSDVEAMELLAQGHDELEEVAASGNRPKLPSFADLNAAKGKRALAKPTPTQRARGSLRDRHGNPIESARDLADAFTAASSLKSGQSLRIASADWRDSYGDDRKLTGDVFTDTEKLAAQQSLVASGGTCSPLAVDFSLPFFSTAARPLRDALPSFNADRGGVRYLLPAAFTSAASATTVWTEATDANPGTATKPVATLTCGDVQETFVDAVPTRLKFGNFQGRFAPEQVANWTETALAYAARVAELNLLSKISASSTLVSSGQLLGASRDLLATFDQAAAAYRYRTRIPRSQRITLLLPDYVKDMCRADIARQMATSTASDDPLAVSDERIASWFGVRGLDPIWMLDAQDAVTGALPIVSQQWGSQSADAPLLGWPTQLTWWMYAVGTFSFLDGGQLEFDMVRDSSLDSTNDYEAFIETFEGVAKRGLESLQVVSAIRPNGASAGTVQTATSPNVY